MDGNGVDLSGFGGFDGAGASLWESLPLRRIKVLALFL